MKCDHALAYDDGYDRCPICGEQLRSMPVVFEIPRLRAEVSQLRREIDKLRCDLARTKKPPKITTNVPGDVRIIQL